MTRVIWGDVGQRFYETGADRGVLFVGDDPGVAWSGLISISETSSGGEPAPFYLDGYKYLQISASEEFAATLAAFSAPAEFGVCDGSAMIAMGLFVTQQPRQKFGLTYRTLIGNDLEEAGVAGYKLHLVYNALSQPSDKSNASLNDSVTPLSLSWPITTVPKKIDGAKPTSHLIIDSRYADPSSLQAIEDLLYGTEGTDASLPEPEDLIAMLS